MVAAIHSIGVSGLNILLTSSTFVLDHLKLHQLLDFKASSANISPLSETPSAFFIRSYWKDAHRVVHVYDSEGTQVYSFERSSIFNPVWSLLSLPDRKQIATINSKFFNRAVTFHCLPNLENRKIWSQYGPSGNVQKFHLNDGKLYCWTRGSKFLEQIINPNCGSYEERRLRVARVKLMRQFHFDYEMLIDEGNIHKHVALATGFVSMLTQWGVGDVTDNVGVSFIPSNTTAPVNTRTVRTPFSTPLNTLPNSFQSNRLPNSFPPEKEVTIEIGDDETIELERETMF